MTNREVGAAVVALIAGLAASGALRSGWVAIALALLASAWAVTSPSPRRYVAVPIAGSAWLTSAGPWQGASRWALALTAAVVVGVLLWRVRAATARLGAATLAVILAAAVARSPNVNGAVPTSEVMREVDRYLLHEVDASQLPGVAVVVVEDGRVVFRRGYGRASATRPMTPATPTVIGSTSKSITATIATHLVERGDLELDAPIVRYLPWFDPRDDRAASITVRQLLIDTSGIPTFAGWSMLSGDGRASDARLREIANGLRLTSQPGERFHYSNANYLLLGEVIEATTRQTFSDVAQSTVFDPIGMHDTSASARSDAAQPHRFTFGTPFRSRLPYLEIGVPAGTITSSADDLARYLTFHLGDRNLLDRQSILTPASLARMHAPAVRADGFGVPSGRHYGMGWYIGEIGGEAAVFHSGDVFDSSSSLVMLPHRDLGIAVVANSSNTLTPVAKTLAEGVTATITGTSPPHLARATATATIGVSVVAGTLLAFAVCRARGLLSTPTRGVRAVLRLSILDIGAPASVLLGLPLIFSAVLDRAETVGTVAFWRLVLRAVPDAGALLIIALGLRFVAGMVALTRCAASRTPTPRVRPRRSRRR